MNEQGCNEYGEPAVEPIKMNNPIEEAANRYWRASQIWRDKQESTWTFGDMIAECVDLQRYRGIVAPLTRHLLDAVVRADQQPLEAHPNITQDLGA